MGSRNDYEARRRKMIAETGAFITWALKHPEDVPRLPRRRVEDGGFKGFLSKPGTRALVNAFWQRTLGK